jgi:hypothetical protein
MIFTDPTRSRRRLVVLILSGLFAAHAIHQTSFWRHLRTAASQSADDYQDLRSRRAFGGIPIEMVREALDARLPLDVSVSLDDSILGSGAWHVGLVEGLYPRRVDRSSPHVLAMSISPPEDASSVLASVGSRVLTLGGPAPIDAPFVRLEKERLDLSWLRLAACLIGVFGWGAVAWVFLKKWVGSSGSPWIPLELHPWGIRLLLASSLFGLIVSAATWLQVPLPWTVLTVAGILFAAGAALRSMSRGWRGTGRSLVLPEDLLIAVMAGLLLFQMSRIPIWDPDGRSIWLFHHKQVFASGFFDRRDLLHPDWQWSHTGYPLLIPAWLAQFTSLEGAYNERMASLGIPVLLAAVLSVFGVISRDRLGRWPTALFILALFLIVETTSSNVQADGFLCLFLLVGFLGLCSRRFEPVGWAALLSASLTKQEGLLLAGIVAGLFVVFHPRSRARGWTRRFAPCLALLPAALHALWIDHIGVEGVYHDLRWSEVPSNAARRLSVVIAALPRLLERRPGLWAGAVGLAASVPLVFRVRAQWEGRAAFAAGMAFLIFAVGIMVVSPFKIGWHVETALGRLLLHPALFFSLAPLLLLWDSTAAHDRKEAGSDSSVPVVGSA